MKLTQSQLDEVKRFPFGADFERLISFIEEGAMSIAERCFEEHDNPAHTIADLERENAELRAQVERLQLSLSVMAGELEHHACTDCGHDECIKSRWILEDFKKTGGVPQDYFDLQDRAERLEKENERFKEVMQPGTMGARMGYVWAVAEKYGHSWYSSRDAIIFLDELIANLQRQLAEAAKIPGLPEGWTLERIGKTIYSDRDDIRLAHLAPIEAGNGEL